MELLTEKYLREKLERDSVEPPHSDIHPWVYVHKRCRRETQMPDNVRRNYLADPCFYFMGTHCEHCGGGVPDSQCHWVDTGENLAEYMKRLTKNKSRAYHFFRWSPVILGIFFAILISISVLQKGEPVLLLGFIIWTAMGAAVSWLPLRFLRLFLCRLGAI